MTVWYDSTTAHPTPEEVRAAFGDEPDGPQPRPVLIKGVVTTYPRHPRKRRGLTGRRYRAACRAHARIMRAYRRGLIEPERRQVVLMAPRATVDLVPIDAQSMYVRWTIEPRPEEPSR